MVDEEYPSEEEIEDNLEDETVEAVERQKDATEEVYSDETPTFKQKEDLFSLFWRVVRTSDSSKVGNLDPRTELGDLDFTVRSCQNIENLARTLGHETFGNFFFAKGEIALSTSMSKNGWLPELFVSRKELRTKERRIRPPETSALQPKKRGLFGKLK